jgi:hypothetical protein
MTNDATDFEVYQSGGGCTAIRFFEPEAQTVFALVTDEGDATAPDMTKDDFAFDLGIYNEETGDDLSLWTIHNRKELNDEYEKLLGYRPDDEADRDGFDRIAYSELIELFAGALLFRAHADAK